MGACDSTREYDLVPKEILIDLVRSDREDMIAEYGNDAYSGTWGAKCEGVVFINQSAETEDKAWELFTEGKWDQVNAVKITPKNFQSKLFKDDRLSKLQVELSELNLQKRDMIKNFFEDRKAKRKTFTCIKCSKKTDVDKVTVSAACPHCRRTTFFVSQTEQKKIETQNKRIKAVNDKINARKRALKIDDKSIDKLKAEMATLVSKYKIAKNKTQEKLSGFHTCKSCKSRINTDSIWDDEQKNTCPVCRSKLTNVSKKYDTWDYIQGIRQIANKITKLTGEYWYVGGMCPC
jgi:Zn finger protein HypA/HybF involved in hydrogenase expression